MPNLSVEVENADPSNGVVLAKFSDDAWELNVRARPTEFQELRAVRDFDWELRRTARVGTCAGGSVYWSSAADVVTIAVGHDDETWDVAIQVPVALVDDLVRQVTTPL